MPKRQFYAVCLTDKQWIPSPSRARGKAWAANLRDARWFDSYDAAADCAAKVIGGANVVPITLGSADYVPYRSRVGRASS